jgi:hypothetical protein
MKKQMAAHLFSSLADLAPAVAAIRFVRISSRRGASRVAKFSGLETEWSWKRPKNS